MVSRAEKLAQQKRLDEAAALLLQCETATYYDEFYPWQRQLLGRLQEMGITKAEDLNSREAQARVSSGLGIADLSATQSFEDFILADPNRNPTSMRVRIVSSQLKDQNVADRRFQEMNVLLNSESDFEEVQETLTKYQALYRRALELKKDGITPEQHDAIVAEIRADELVKHDLDKAANMKGRLTDDDILHQLDKSIGEILPKVYLTPVQQTLLETVKAHGIRTPDDLYKPQNALWVMRGMPGTFLETDVRLQPDQSFSVLERGMTQAEIRKSVEEGIIKKALPTLQDSFRRVQTGQDARPFDIETVAILSLNGITSAEELNSEAGKRIALNADKIFEVMKKAYNGEHNPVTASDDRGFPKNDKRSSDMEALLDGYVQTGHMMTVSQLRMKQAEEVMDKVLAGEALSEWENVLYVNLAFDGVSSKEDLASKAVKDRIDSGFEGSLKLTPSQGFAALKSSDLEPWKAWKASQFNESADFNPKPEQLKDLSVLPHGNIAASPVFSGDIYNAFYKFEKGEPLTPRDEELIAVAAVNKFRSARQVMSVSPIKSALMTNIDMRNKTDEGYDLITGKVLSDVQLDAQGFIVGKEYAAGTKEFILKLRDAQKVPADKRVLPATPDMALANIKKAKAFAAAMKKEKETELEKSVPPAPMKKEDAEETRLQEAKALLEKAQDSRNVLSDEEFYLLAALHDNGITKSSDLGIFSRSNRKKVKNGLGLKNIGNRSFKQYTKYEKSDESIRFPSSEIAEMRFMETTMVMEKFADHDHLMAQLDELKEVYRASVMLEKDDLTPDQKARYEEIVKRNKIGMKETGAKRSAKLLKEIEDMIPLAVPTPTDYLIYETLAAHGIHTTDDLNLPQNELFVRRGMPGTFIDRQVGLQPNQTYLALRYGMSQEEIARNQKRETALSATEAYQKSINALQTETKTKEDIENAALMACYGIRTVEDLNTPEAQKLMEDGLNLQVESRSGYDGDALHARADGFADKDRADDVSRMIEGFKANGVLPTIQEVRLAQAVSVVEKAAAGKEMTEWEQTLYAGLAASGVASRADLDKPEIKASVEQGLSDKFGKPSARGFNKLSYADMSDETASRVLAFQNKISAQKNPTVDRMQVMQDFSKIMERVDLYEVKVEKPMQAARQRMAAGQQKNPTVVRPTMPQTRSGGRD